MAWLLRASKRAGLGVWRASGAYVKWEGVLARWKEQWEGAIAWGWSQVLGGFPNGSKLRFTGAGACSFLSSVTQCNYSLGLKNQGSRATLVLWTKEAQSLREVRTLDSSPCSLSQKAIPSSLACPSILDLGKYENASRGGYNLNLCTQSKISTPRRGWPGSP